MLPPELLMSEILFYMYTVQKILALCRFFLSCFNITCFWALSWSKLSVFSYSFFDLRLTLHTGISLHNNLHLIGVENDIAVIKVKNGSALECKKEVIWPACLPRKVTYFAIKHKEIHLIMLYFKCSEECKMWPNT